MFCNQQQPDLWQDRFDSWVVKCTTSLFNSLCSNVVKRLQNHCYPFYWTFRTYLLSMFGKGRGEGRGRWAVNQNLMLIPYFSHVNLRMCSAFDKRQRQKILPQRTPRNSRNKHNAEEYCHGCCFHLQDTYASVAIKQIYYVIYLGQGENIVRNVLPPVEPLFNPLSPCSDPQPISPKNNTAWSNIQVMRMNKMITKDEMLWC